MKCGGNANAADFFKKHGGMDKYTDAKAKYSSRAGQMYREYLKKLAEDDARRSPDRIVIEGFMDEDVSAFSSSQGDFFADWENTDKPQAKRQSSYKTETFVIENTGTNSNPELKVSPLTQDMADFAPQPVPIPQPVPVVAEPIAMKPSVSSQGPTYGVPRPAAKKGLGAKKAIKIDFAEAERRAKEQETLRLQAEEEEKKRRVEEEKKKAENPMGYVAEKMQEKANQRPNSQPGYVPVVNVAPVKVSDEMADRLGLGLGRIQLAATNAAVEKATKVAQLNAKYESSNDAQQRFTNAKAISSDEYFGRGRFNEAEK